MFTTFFSQLGFSLLGHTMVFLAHLSQRLIGELIVYPWSVKVKTVDFSESIAACDLKVTGCRQLIE